MFPRLKKISDKFTVKEMFPCGGNFFEQIHIEKNVSMFEKKIQTNSH